MKNGTQAKIGATLGRKVYAVDLFCGAGGLTHGLVKAGVDVRLGVDIDPTCEHPYVANNNARFLLKSVEELEAGELGRYYRTSVYRKTLCQPRGSHIPGGRCVSATRQLE